MRIAAVMAVRNEAELIALNVRYHAAQGISDFFVLDNGSSDDTVGCLRELARDHAIRWTIDSGPYHQEEMVNALVADAVRAGAEWIVPIDADEFWSAGRRRLGEVIERASAGALEGTVVNFIQQRQSVATGAAALLTMTYRAKTVFSYQASEDLIEAGHVGFVEGGYPPKWIARASTGLRFGAGAHTVEGLTRESVLSDLVCLHAPLRSRSALDARANYAQRFVEDGLSPRFSWQNRRWHRLRTEGDLDAEWSANSVLDGALHLGRRRTEVVFDPRLRNAVQPWVDRRSSPVEHLTMERV